MSENTYSPLHQSLMTTIRNKYFQDSDLIPETFQSIAATCREDIR